MIVDRPTIRVVIKSLVVLAAGLSGLLAQSLLWAAVVLIVLSVVFQVFDYLLSNRLTTLVLERLAGIIEAGYHICGFPVDDDVRATIFAPSPTRRNALRQVGTYYPTNKRSHFKRGLSTSKGIVGYSFRTGKRSVEVIRRVATFKKHLVEKWGFTREETDLVTFRRSYLAIPVFSAGGGVVGVAYFDSMKANTFSPQVIDNLTRCCVPLSRWLG